IGCPTHLFFSTPHRSRGRDRGGLESTHLHEIDSSTFWRDRSVSSPFVRGLKCRLCGQAYPISATNFCTEDFGPLEVDYDYDAIAEAVSRGKLQLRPDNMWRYQEFLPLDGEPTVGRQVGGTPLVRADRLAAALGVEKLWIKNDAVNFPTLSFKDRV